MHRAPTNKDESIQIITFSKYEKLQAFGQFITSSTVQIQSYRFGCSEIVVPVTLFNELMCSTIPLTILMYMSHSEE